ncbi:MAG: T9SS type A sorting domain-containing protein [Bacteroidales bacterium]
MVNLETTQTIEAASGGEVGIVTFSVEVTDVSGCTGADEIVVSFDECAGIGDTYRNGSFTIAPNPNNGLFNFDLQLENIDNVDVVIFEFLNATVFEKRNSLGTDFKYQVDLSHLSLGIYYLQVSGKITLLTKKIVIQ